MGEPHSTVRPPTREEQERSRSTIALEVLRSLHEDWEFMTDSQQRQAVRNTIRVLEHE